MIACLIQIDAKDAMGAPVVVRAASYDDPRCCHLNGAIWWPMIERLPSLRYELFSGAFDGKLSTPASDLTLSVEAWPDLPNWRFADARFQLWIGNLGAAWGTYSRLVDGIVTGQPPVEGGAATINFQVDDRWLDDPLLDLYEGYGGIEGGVELRGQPKPLAVGAPRFAQGAMLDPAALIVQLSAYGPIETVESMFDRVVRNGPPAGDYPSYAALDAAPLRSGQWATCLAQGLVRHGAAPEGQLSYHMRGDKGGSDGWARLPGKIIRRLAQIRGYADRVDDVSINAFDAMAAKLPDGGTMSLQVRDQITLREQIQKIAASYNCTAGVSWLGRLFVAPVLLGPAAAEIASEAGDFIGSEDGNILGVEGFTGDVALQLNADGSSEPAVGDVRQFEAGPPAWRLALQAQRTWTEHALGDVAFDAELNDRGLYNPATIYRVGDIAWMANKSQWLWINDTPAAGHAPPDPSSGDAFWKNLAPAPGADVLKYTDGRTLQDMQPDEGGAQITRSLDLSESALTFVLDGITPAAGQLPYYVQATLTKGDDIDTGATTFEIIAAAGITASIDDTPGSPTRGRITITNVTAKGTIIVGALSGNVYLQKTITIDTVGALAKQAIVTTPLIQAGAVSATIALTSTAALTGSGSPPSTVNSNVVPTYTMSLDVDTTVLFFINGAQAYSGSADYAGVLAINGTEQAAAYAGAGVSEGSFSRQVARQLAAGSYSIDFLWRGSAGVTLLAGATIIMFKIKR